MSDALRERVTAILWDEDHRVPGKGESAWARYQRLADALLNEDGPLVQDFRELADDLEKPDPWMHGDDYGEGYVDGKNLAARRIRAVLAGEGPR